MFYDFALPRTVIGPDWSVIGPDWSVASLVLLFHPIRYKSEIIRDLVTYVSRASCSLFVFTFSSHWLIMLFPFFRLSVVIIWFWTYDAQSKCALKLLKQG